MSLWDTSVGTEWKGNPGCMWLCVLGMLGFNIRVTENFATAYFFL